MTIRAKIFWILLFPFAGLVVFALFQVAGELETWRAAQSAQRQTPLAVQTSLVVHNLQLERGMSGGFLSSHGTKYAAELPAQRLKTDQAVRELSTASPSGAGT